MNWIWLAYVTLGTAAVYATLSFSVVLVYQTNKVLPFHVGSIAMVFAYVMSSVWSPRAGALMFLAALFAAVFVAVLVGAVMHLLVDRWGQRYGHFVGTVITIAATTFFSGLMSLIWRGEARRIEFVPGRTTFQSANVTYDGLLVIGVGVAVVVLVLVAVTSTKLGVQMQAVASSQRLAHLRGVSVRGIQLSAWVASTILAGIGGTLMALLSTVSLEGSVIGVSGIVAAVIGGMHSLPGAILGALLLAACENLVVLFFDPRYSQAVPVLLLVLLLVFRPSGLSGRTENIERV